MGETTGRVWTHASVHALFASRKVWKEGLLHQWLTGSLRTRSLGENKVRPVDRFGSNDLVHSQV